MAENESPQNTQLTGALLSRRTVLLSGDINRRNTEDIGHRMLELQTRSNDRINLIIDSGGGGTDAAFDICDLMTVVITAPIRGIALGLCGSAATFIMLHCTERIGAPNSRFIIHSGTFHPQRLDINKDLEKNLELIANEARGVEERILRMYMKRLTPGIWIGKNPDDAERRSFVERLIRRGDQEFDYRVQAPEAVEIGLIQEVTSDKIDIFSI